MLVSKAKYEDLNRALKAESRRRQEAEDKAAWQAARIERLQSQVAHEEDEHPTTPVPVQPATGDARLTQQLELSERARGHLDATCRELHWTTVVQEREISQLQAEIVELRAAAQGVAS